MSDPHPDPDLLHLPEIEQQVAFSVIDLLRDAAEAAAAKRRHASSLPGDHLHEFLRHHLVLVRHARALYRALSPDAAASLRACLAPHQLPLLGPNLCSP